MINSRQNLTHLINANSFFFYIQGVIQITIRLDKKKLVESCHNIKSEELAEFLSLSNDVFEYTSQLNSKYTNLYGMLFNKFKQYGALMPFGYRLDVRQTDDLWQKVPARSREIYENIADDLSSVVNKTQKFYVCLRDSDDLREHIFPSIEIPAIFDTKNNKTETTLISVSDTSSCLLMLYFLADKEYVLKSLRRLRDKMCEQNEEASNKFFKLKMKLDSYV